ncbi:MAG TPA: ATP-binding protein [Kineosporiaceae bacterium]
MNQDASSPPGHLVERRVRRALDEALSDTRVVLVNGARQAGKSTLVRLVADQLRATWRTLDHEATRQAALEDPAGFVEAEGPMVIDEIQRVPELLLAIKEVVDRDHRPGRFLLTGSARILGLRSVADVLPGRMETLELYPFSQGEMAGTPDAFVDAVFASGAGLRHDSDLQRGRYAELITRGGFPEAVARPTTRRRGRFLDAYVDDLINRDVSQIGGVERVAELRALVRLLAARSGHLLKAAALGNEIGLPHSTIARYLSLLEMVFLLKRIPAWSRNLSRRATSTPKVTMVDSGIAANLLDLDADRLVRPGAPFGPLLEGFVLMELSRQLTWSEERVELFHYRTRDQIEVDAVLENRRGHVVGIEVKAASTVRPEDFRGLRHLRDRLEDDLLVGLVLYTGHQTLPFGDRLRAMPISALWEVPASA